MSVKDHLSITEDIANHGSDYSEMHSCLCALIHCNAGRAPRAKPNACYTGVRQKTLYQGKTARTLGVHCADLGRYSRAKTRIIRPRK